MIYCVEDDDSIRDIEVYALNSSELPARGFSEPNSFFEALETEELPSLIVLDVMLPNISGFEILDKLKRDDRYSSIPVILATAKDAEFDKVRGLDAGADYYITKPFGVLEFVSCTKSVLRRYSCEKDKILKCGDVVLDLKSRSVAAQGKSVALSFTEFELLRHLIEHKGTVFSRDSLFREVWNSEYLGSSRTVDMHIKTLRSKLGSSANIIKTVRNVGYKAQD